MRTAHLDVLRHPPVIQIGAGTGGRTSVAVSSQTNLDLTHVVDRIGKKILHIARQTDRSIQGISRSGEEALRNLPAGFVVGVIDNGRSLPRILQAMRSHRHKGMVITFFPAANHPEVIAVFSLEDPDLPRRNLRFWTETHPALEALQGVPASEGFLGVPHADGGFFNPISGRQLPLEHQAALPAFREEIIKKLAHDPGNVSRIAQMAGPHGVARRSGSVLHVHGVHPKVARDTEEALTWSDRHGLAVWSREGTLVMPEGARRIYHFQRNIRVTDRTEPPEITPPSGPGLQPVQSLSPPRLDFRFMAILAIFLMAATD